MPRDNLGVYSLPAAAGNPVISGSLIASSWANQTMDDIAKALTDSLDRNGRGGMNVPLNFADGTAALPGITWASEESTGFYRFGLGDMRVSVLGTDSFKWDSTGSYFWDGAGWVQVGTGGGGGGDLPDGTTNYQTLVWNNGTGAWSATSLLETNFTSSTVTTTGTMIAAQFNEGGTVLAAKYLGISDRAADSDLLNGQAGSYYLAYGNFTGTIPDSALAGPYSIDITGNATTATDADTVDGTHIVIGDNTPADPNTLYFVI
jgi:hypothetical protein